MKQFQLLSYFEIFFFCTVFKTAKMLLKLKLLSRLLFIYTAYDKYNISWRLDSIAHLLAASDISDAPLWHPEVLQMAQISHRP